MREIVTTSKPPRVAVRRRRVGICRKLRRFHCRPCEPETERPAHYTYMYVCCGGGLLPSFTNQLYKQATRRPGMPGGRAAQDRIQNGAWPGGRGQGITSRILDRKSTRLNSSHLAIPYA